MIQLAMQGHDVDPHAVGPVMQVGPGQLAFHGAVHGHQPGTRLFKGEAVERGIPARQLFLEKKIVEMAVEERAVHIEQHIVDSGPIDRVIGDG